MSWSRRFPLKRSFGKVRTIAGDPDDDEKSELDSIFESGMKSK